MREEKKEKGKKGFPDSSLLRRYKNYAAAAVVYAAAIPWKKLEQRRERLLPLRSFL